MGVTVSGEVDSIVQTFLRIGDRVVRLSKDMVVSAIWDNENSPFADEYEAFYLKKVTDMPPGSHLGQCIGMVNEVLLTNKNCYREFIGVFGGVMMRTCTWAIIESGSEGLLIVMKQHPVDNYAEIPGNKWKLALDAAGDGIWDLNILTGEMTFSDKWHEMFGYAPGEIRTLADWSAKLHTDDYKVAEQNFNKYLEGLTPAYSVELRYKCKDGSVKWILSRGVFAAKSADGLPLRFIGTHTDINERKLMDEERRANLSLLLKLINSLPSGILVTDELKKLVFANKAFCNLYAANTHPKALAGTDTWERMQQDKLLYRHPEDFIKRVETILEEKKMVLNEELELVDGRTISRDYIPLSFKENYRGEIWKFSDVTLQKNVEKRFEEQRLFYEHILHSMPANIATLNGEGRILYANPNGIKNEEVRRWVIGKTLEEYCLRLGATEAITKERIAYFNTAIHEKRKVEWDEKLMSRSGKTYYQLRCFSPILKPEGGLDIMIAYGVDITDRILAEQALKASLNAFAHSFNYSGIGKALLAPEGRWLEVNDKICELTGYTRDELFALHPRDLSYPADMNIDLPYVVQLLNKEIPAYTVQKRYVSKNRQILTTSVTVSLVWNEDETPRYFICDIVDISKQKELTDQIQRKNAELEATTASLNTKIAQLEELNHIIAHNLRGPASNIRMLSERLIIDDNDPAAEDEAFTKDEAGAIIHESSILLSNSLNTLMELMQIKLNTHLRYDDCVLTEMISDISKQLYGMIYEKQAKISTEIDVAYVHYPKVYLESILYNLISNALKYCSLHDTPEITISARRDGEKTKLSVKDNGLGIDLDKYGHKVFKLNQVFHRGYDSKGVGLYLTKAQIESLGGKTELTSKVNEGSEFIVTL